MYLYICGAEQSHTSIALHRCPLHTPPQTILSSQVLALIAVGATGQLTARARGLIAQNTTPLLTPPSTLPTHKLTYTQVLALIAVRATELLTARARGLIAQNTALADAFFGRWAALFEWRRPGAGPIAFPRCGYGCRESHKFATQAQAGKDAWCSWRTLSAGVDA